MRALLYIWQLPQNLVGLLLLWIFKHRKHEDDGFVWYYCPQIEGGISLGDYILLERYDKVALRHEYGHCIQSRILGWLYLPLVGIPSLLWNCVYGLFIEPTENGYYKFYTEKWADSLGGVKRK
jgi:hypothetical protein